MNRNDRYLIINITPALKPDKILKFLPNNIIMDFIFVSMIHRFMKITDVSTPVSKYMYYPKQMFCDILEKASLSHIGPSQRLVGTYEREYSTFCNLKYLFK